MTPPHTGRLLLTPADPWLAVDPHLLRATLESLGFIGQPLPVDLEPRDAIISRLPGQTFPAGTPAADGGPGALTQPPVPSQGFLVGEHFFDLLAFAGCAVNLRLTPTSTGEPFTHVHLVGPLASPLLLLGCNTRPPRCPTCRAPNKALTLFPDQNQSQNQNPGQDTQGDLEVPWGRNRVPGLGQDQDQEPGLEGELEPGLGQELSQDSGRKIPCPACGSRHPLWTWDWKGKAGSGRSFVWVEEVFPGEAEPTPSFQAALTSLTASPWRHFYLQDSYGR